VSWTPRRYSHCCTRSLAQSSSRILLTGPPCRPSTGPRFTADGLRTALMSATYAPTWRLSVSGSSLSQWLMLNTPRNCGLRLGYAAFPWLTARAWRSPGGSAFPPSPPMARGSAWISTSKYSRSGDRQDRELTPRLEWARPAAVPGRSGAAVVPDTARPPPRRPAGVRTRGGGSEPAPSVRCLSVSSPGR
jgi:hypothetical protein